MLETIQGFRFDFDSTPRQTLEPKQLLNSDQDIAIASSLLQELLDKQVIEPTKFHRKGYISNIFLRDKKSGDHRLILNLKNLNQCVEYHHFKMEHLATALTLVTKDCFLASLDLSDAYYSVPVSSSHRKYLQFRFNGQSYRFTCLANGVSSAPRTFTKLMKIPLSFLREHHGITITSYLDDLLIIAQSKKGLLESLDTTQTLLRSLGFTISVKKSSIQPAHAMTYLGFLIDSSSMTVSLTSEKSADIKQLLSATLQQSTLTIRSYAGVLGKLAATLPASRHGLLHMKYLETHKTKALRKSGFSYEGSITLSQPVREELQWWLDNIQQVHRPIYTPKPDFELYTDASFLGWGCFVPSSQLKAGGRWGVEDQGKDINVLELKAILLSLQTVCSSQTNSHIRIYSDNTSAVIGITRQGSTHSASCNSLVQQIWAWAIPLNVWLSTAHCPGVLNVEADDASRVFNDFTEWRLSSTVFTDIRDRFGCPDIDMFASRLNNQVSTYCAWQPDPGAIAIDAFSLEWDSFQLIYCFPPFSLTAKVLQKVTMDKAQAIIVVPKWPTQPWYSRLQDMLTHRPLQIPVNHKTLTLAHDPDIVHPLVNRLTLLACRVSGDYTSQRDFQ